MREWSRFERPTASKQQRQGESQRASLGSSDVKWEKQYIALKMWRWPLAGCLAGVTPPIGPPRRGATLGNGCERNNIAMLGPHKSILVMTLLYLPLPI